ncbi:Protein CBG19556 [Caenorhabditis briggsae]|uniref:Protein CBG19556 n=1 Tax=Caenorhabditis briggsae TaxID=6238 RepID=A8XVW2_CAEBR|nr:Protein CBG19556 [Caenorhabditis briggsae]CAP36781.2 Protein CBG19556 [Caenorhabditis briggsae]
MWQHLKTSKNVLWDFYYIYEQRWAHIYMDQLMELTGKTERQVSDILQYYRSIDYQHGIRIPCQKYTPTQTYYLKKAYRESRYAGKDKTTYLVKKTRLLRNQEINTWYFNKLDVLCDASIQYKDQSLINIRDIIAAQFVNELKYQNDTPWNSTVEFIQYFTKHGNVELNDCVKDTKYQLDDSAVPSPALPDQFMKYMKRNVKLYSFKWERNLNYTLQETDRNSLDFDVSFKLPEKNWNVKCEVGLFHSRRYYHISELKQSGTCANAGEVVPFEPRDLEADDKNATVMWFQGAFAPKFPAWTDSDISNLPTHFLQLLKTSVKINVCHENKVEEVEYTKEQFLSWYRHFEVMWAVPDSSHFTHQLLNMGDKFISGRVTMKLVTRSVKDAPERDWQFKYVATHYGKDWELSSLYVLCNDAVEYKDESYLHIRKIIAKDLWKMWRKWRSLRFRRDGGRLLTELDMFAYDRQQRYNFLVHQGLTKESPRFQLKIEMNSISKPSPRRTLRIQNTLMSTSDLSLSIGTKWTKCITLQKSECHVASNLKMAYRLMRTTWFSIFVERDIESE